MGTAGAVSNRGEETLDLAPPRLWKRTLPAWLRALIWVDGAAKYDAFLSYSWKRDREVAPVIQSLFQNFLRPWYKVRAKTIFRDLSCLPAGSSLEAELFDRLDRSEHLIVLASPEAAHSRGMEMEASYWFTRERAGQVLIIVTVGDYNTWPEVREHLVPATIRQKLSEPLLASITDLRPKIVNAPKRERTAVMGALTERLNQAILRFYPGRNWGDLRGQERLIRRRAILLLSGAALLLLMLASAAVGFGYYAENERAVAERELDHNRRLLYSANTRLAYDALPVGDFRRIIDALRPSLPAHTPGPDLRAFEWYYALLSCHCDSVLIGQHRSLANEAAISPNGKLIASAGDDGVIKLWLADTRQEIATLRGHAGPVTSVAFSPGGEMLASAGTDGSIRLWDTASRQQLAELAGARGSAANQEVIIESDRTALAIGHYKQVLAFSPDGKLLASGGWDRKVRLWDVATRREIAVLTGHGEAVSAVAFSPNGMLASGSEDNTIKIWEAEKRQNITTLKGHSSTVTALAFSQDGSQLASASLDKTVKLWDMRSAFLTATLQRPKAVGSVTFLNGRDQIAMGQADGKIAVWNFHDSRETATLRGHDGFVSSLCVSRDGGSLVSASWDGSVRLWSAVVRPESAIANRHFARVTSVTFSPDGKAVASSSMDSAVRVWGIREQRVVLDIWGRLPSASSVAFSPSGRMIAAGYYDNNARLWNTAASDASQVGTRRLRDGDEARVLAGHAGYVLSVAFSPVRDILATASWDGTAKIWDAASGRELFTLKGHAAPLTSVSFSRDGQFVATGSRDKTARVWSSNTGKEIANLASPGPVWQVAFSPDGAMLGVSTRNYVSLWDVKTRHKIADLRGHTGGERVAFCFSPDGRTLATGSSDGTIRLWNVATYQQISVLSVLIPDQLSGQRPAVITSLAFSPDGRTLATGGDDGDWVVRLWTGATDAEVVASPVSTSERP